RGARGRAAPGCPWRRPRAAAALPVLRARVALAAATSGRSRLHGIRVDVSPPRRSGGYHPLRLEEPRKAAAEGGRRDHRGATDPEPAGRGAPGGQADDARRQTAGGDRGRAVGAAMNGPPARILILTASYG